MIRHLDSGNAIRPMQWWRVLFGVTRGSLYMNAGEVVAILAGISGLIAGIIAAFSSARKAELDVVRGAMDSVVAENKRLTTRMMELEKCIAEAEDAQREAHITILRLSNQLEEWKDKYTRMDAEWKWKYQKLQNEFNAFKAAGGTPS